MSARLETQHDLEGVLLYLANHGQHVHSIHLEGNMYNKTHVTLRQLPPNLQLENLELGGFHMQLQPHSAFEGVMRPGMTLKQLKLANCKLLDGAEGLAAALALLPDLQHLSFSVTFFGRRYGCQSTFRTEGLSGLQYLTYLELAGDIEAGPVQDGPVLQPLQAMTRLVDLRLSCAKPAVIDSSIMSGMKHLTLLKLSEETYDYANTLQFDPEALAGKTQLQHLSIHCSIPGGAAGIVQLLCHLPLLQQLTHLDLAGSLTTVLGDFGIPPATAYSALTACSKLQHLNISRCKLPGDAWQHVFPAGRQLPHLQTLHISHVLQHWGDCIVAPEGTRLASCCPGLQVLDMENLQCNGELCAPLKGLRSLHTLRLASRWTGWEGWGFVAQLSGLQELALWAPITSVQEEGLLLQLSQLKQLTQLEFEQDSGAAAGGGSVIMRTLVGDLGRDVRDWQPMCI
jgi:hypothetical protein